ncbi:SpoIID/LytB domain-containing protein [uncultured Ilyobacter sp.]|uniref:SpoIID/LytB domain-containing protein n=1 Tax=uncultured Ilyobacter sp. TaxID=544433 RepID=UPI0029F45FA6|nr:SpoIID/LytB domain-containing protein [uncultured Ilyobacter sp.]
MRTIIMLFTILFLKTISFSFGNFIQEDLRVALNKFSGEKVFFKAQKGSLFVEIGDGLEKVTVEVPQGQVKAVTMNNSNLSFEGEKSEIIRVYQGEFDSVFSISRDGEEFIPYRGDLEFITYKNQIMPVNSVQSEEYLYSVVPSEIGSYFPEEAIKAQILAARTYLYHNIKNYKYKEFDLMDNVNSQMYLGKGRENSKINALVDNTVGEIIVFDGRPINALYHSTSGGITANNEDVWGGNPVPYLRSRDDSNNEEKSPRKKWTTSITKSELSRGAGFPVKKIEVLSMNSGRVITLRLIGSDKKTVSGNEFRRMVGYNTIYSTQFQIKDDGEKFVFFGKGSGHGVGMSQYGAYGLAVKGKKYREIIFYYYTGVEIKTLKNGQNML